MKTLYVLRHAKSWWDDPSLADHDRPLDARGERAALVVGRYMRQQGFAPDRVLCSSARRAIDTLVLVRSQWDTVPTIDLDRALYLSGARAILNRIATLDAGTGSVLVVGHNPDLHNLVVNLAAKGNGPLLEAAREKFPTASLAVIKLPLDDWQGIVSTQGRLIGYVTPKTLV